MNVINASYVEYRKQIGDLFLSADNLLTITQLEGIILFTWDE